MSKFQIGDHVKAAITSKHYKCTGTIVDPNGDFILVKCDEDSKNPLAWKSTVHGEGKFFCLNKDLVIKLKETK